MFSTQDMSWNVESDDDKLPSRLFKKWWCPTNNKLNIKVCIRKNVHWALCIVSFKVTVGQRKKVTAVTFFPARPRSDQRGTNTGQIRKVPVDEIAWFLVYRMDVTRSQLSANNGILVCLVREIWQFKFFAGKEVTALPATRGEGGYWRWGRRLLCLCWNWIALSFLKHWK